MKKIVGILLMVVMVLLLLSSCGVAQENYDAAVTESDAAQSQVASLQSDLSKVKSELSAVYANVASLQEDCDAVMSDLTAAQSAQSSAESAKSAAERELSSVKTDLAELQAKIAELEAAAAPAEEEATEEEVAEEEAAEEEKIYKLELLECASVTVSESWCQVTGKVKNVGNASLKDVEVVCHFYTEGGKLVTSASAVIGSDIGDNPILPNQTSVFRVEAMDCGTTKRYSVFFRFKSGEAIPWDDKRK